MIFLFIFMKTELAEEDEDESGKKETAEEKKINCCKPPSSFPLLACSA